jgi:glycosyltransferase involved in cell wall biosynthesis
MPVTLSVAYTLEQCWHRVPGGTATSALGAARALASRPEIQLVGVAARHGTPPPAAFAPPIEVRHLPLPRAALYESWHTLRWPAVQRATGPVDVIHATGMAVPPRSAPLVVTVHDLAFLHHPEHATRHGLRFFRRSLQLTRRHADLILCPSDATRRDCLSQGIEPHRLWVVPWGVEARRPTDAEIAATRARFGLARPYVLAVGTIEPRKNLGALLDAFARLARPDLDLVLVGPAGWNEDLGPRISRLGDRVRALGFVPHDELAPLYGGARAFCYPSLLEGFGMPVLEAQAAGAPVITSAGTATAEAAGDAAILVDPREVKEIAEAIERVLDDAQLADDLRARGFSRVATFTWERTADLTLAAYREVAR